MRHGRGSGVGRRLYVSWNVNETKYEVDCEVPGSADLQLVYQSVSMHSSTCTDDEARGDGNANQGLLTISSLSGYWHQISYHLYKRQLAAEP